MNNDGTLVHIKFPNISPEIFQIILKYVYGDPTTWSDDDFKTMENTLQHCLPLHQLYEELLESYLNPNSVPSDNILPPRYRSNDGIIDSTIINLNIISLISRWIDNDDNFKDSILSHVDDASNALFYHNRFGPTFGNDDFDMYANEGNDKEYDYFGCKQRSYEKKIRDIEGVFSMEDYEVFQIIRKND
ncbi:BTB/POZ protein [Rhizophagus irregularis DAOM 181602=DAOM 197198]|nr:BTB/POZ protein [Rhizophagus irregularis DAOM 181602=DAOM 197198]